ncbi:hypothetical protein PCLA_02f0467 [Pseudomonas citronellolis]|nr:hypothetical protein PCLA_02f0467 [Pseudomonas citronellolis]
MGVERLQAAGCRLQAAPRLIWAWAVALVRRRITANGYTPYVAGGPGVGRITFDVIRRLAMAPGGSVKGSS